MPPRTTLALIRRFFTEKKGILKVELFQILLRNTVLPPLFLNIVAFTIDHVPRSLIRFPSLIRFYVLLNLFFRSCFFSLLLLSLTFSSYRPHAYVFLLLCELPGRAPNSLIQLHFALIMIYSHRVILIFKITTPIFTPLNHLTFHAFAFT